MEPSAEHAAAAATAVPASAALSQSTTVAVTVLVGLLSLSIFALRSYLRKTALKKLPGALARPAQPSRAQRIAAHPQPLA